MEYSYKTMAPIPSDALTSEIYHPLGVSPMLVTLKCEATAGIYRINKFRTNLRPGGAGDLSLWVIGHLFPHFPSLSLHAIANNTERNRMLSSLSSSAYLGLL